MKLTSNTTIHTPDYDLHDWDYERQARLDDCKDAYVCDRLDGLRSAIAAMKAPAIFTQAMENMDSDEIEKLHRWLFKIWQARNPHGEAGNTKYAVRIIADILHDSLLQELDEEVKQQYE